MSFSSQVKEELEKHFTGLNKTGIAAEREKLTRYIECAERYSELEKNTQALIIQYETLAALPVNLEKIEEEISYMETKILGMLNAQCEDLRFVQITDVRYSEKNKELLEKIIDDVNKQDNIDFVVFTGDNIQKLCLKDLDSFITTAKQLNAPFYVLIGDKDINKNNSYIIYFSR